MLVYRFEHEIERCGPYNTGSVPRNHRLCNDHNKRVFDDRPGFVDYDDYPADGYVSGCPSLETLKEWFDGFVDYLFKRRYAIYVYDVDDEDCIIGKSGIQCIFDKSSAHQVDMLIKV